MKNIVSILIILLFTSCSSIENKNLNEDNVPLLIKISFSDHGSYGNSWFIDIKAFPELDGGTVQVTHYTSKLGAESYEAFIFLSPEIVNKLYNIVTQPDFESLPEAISSEFIAFHMPEYFLTVCTPKCRRVDLYDPKQIPNNKNKDKFLNIWKSIFQTLPKSKIGWPVEPA